LCEAIREHGYLDSPHADGALLHSRLETALGGTLFDEVDILHETEHLWLWFGGVTPRELCRPWHGAKEDPGPSVAKEEASGALKEVLFG
jgi:hypothetical protein